MAIFRVNRYEQVKVWMAQDIYFEAANMDEAKKLAQDAQSRGGEINTEIIDWGEYAYQLETEESSGHYDWTDEDINEIEEI